MEPHIILEDNDVLVLNKPAGMTVNKADTTKNEPTLQDWVENKFKIPASTQRGEQNSKFKITDTYNAEEVFKARAGIVHRLDKETSGIIIVAKNVEAFQNLQKQFKDRTVKKSYLALSHGKVEQSMGEINVPVGRLPWNRMRFGVVADGRHAITRYRVNSKFLAKPDLASRDKSSKLQEDLTFLEVFPETGRTHQIRVHLKHINHPIFGDALYAGRKTARADRQLLPRVFLHAHTLSFMHPSSNQPVHIVCPLPKDLQDLLNKLEEE